MDTHFLAFFLFDSHGLTRMLIVVMRFQEELFCTK